MLVTHELVSETIKKALNSDCWEPAGSYASHKEVAQYWIYETVHRIGEPYYWFIACEPDA